jgi:hypothetical protein
MPSHSYNSVIYASTGANSYYVFLVNQTFFEPRQANLSSPDQFFGLMGFSGYSTAYAYESLILEDPLQEPSGNLDQYSNAILGNLQESALVGTLDRLDNEQCIRSYSTMFLSDRSNLLLVASGFPLSDVLNEVPDQPSLNEVDPHNWTVATWTETNETSIKTTATRVDYCMSQPTEAFCKLRFNLPIAIVIILFNFFKAVIMLILAFGLRETRVQTMGDAIASFLIQPDHIVNGRCLYSASDFKQAGLLGHPRDLMFTRKSIRFAKTVKKRVWIPAYLL